MKKIIPIIKDHIITGAIVIIPLAVVGVILADVMKEIIAKTTPFTDIMVLGGPISRAIVASIIIIIVLGLFFFISGLILKTYLGKSFKYWLEKKVLTHIPFYETISSIAHQFAGVGKVNYQVVEVDLYGTANKLLGLITQTLTDGRHIVYIPFAPVINMGQLHIIPKENVKILDISVKEATDIITAIGFEANKIIKEKKQKVNNEK